MFNPRRFAINLTASTIGVMVLDAVLSSMFRIDVSNAYTAVLPALISAMVEGQKYAEETGRRPEKAEIWRISGVMAEIYLTVTVIFCVVLAIVSLDMRALFANINLIILFSIFGIFTGLALVFSRVGYGVGVKAGLKARNNNTG
ncbi:MAG: ABZJ_00895 family protein [Roseobacter sp.]|jgi:hypothetical protein|nr:ABZJ_00895 family protein [Roseobacter sp.]